MKKLILWSKISSMSAYTCGLLGIIYLFFKKYIHDFVMFFIIVEVLLLAISLFAELMKFILKRKGNE